MCRLEADNLYTMLLQICQSPKTGRTRDFLFSTPVQTEWHIQPTAKWILGLVPEVKAALPLCLHDLLLGDLYLYLLKQTTYTQLILQHPYHPPTQSHTPAT